MRRLLKKDPKKLEHKKRGKDSKVIPIKSYSEDEETSKVNLKKPSLKQRLFVNYAEAIERFAIWLPLFLGAWLSSGFVLTNVIELGLISLPLLFQYIFRTREKKEEIFLENQVLTFFRVIPYVSALYLYSELNRPDLSICLILSGLFLEGYFIKVRSAKSIILKAIFISLFMATTSQMSILSQIPFTNLSNIFLGYSLMGLIPGTVLASRCILLNSDKFLAHGWAIGSYKKSDRKGVEKDVPTNYTKLVMFLLIIGPAIPALLMPFNILPNAFLSSSALFFILPKLADKIQNATEPESLKLSSISVALLALGLEIALFLATLIGI